MRTSCLEVAALAATGRHPQRRTLLYLRDTKGGGEAHVPAHPLVLAALEDLRIDGDGLWGQANRKTVAQRVGDFLRSVGVQGGAHQLRHFAGTSWYRASGHDLLATAALLRHKNVTTTMTEQLSTRPAAPRSSTP